MDAKAYLIIDAPVADIVQCPLDRNQGRLAARASRMFQHVEQLMSTRKLHGASRTAVNRIHHGHHPGTGLLQIDPDLIGIGQRQGRAWGQTSFHPGDGFIGDAAAVAHLPIESR